MDLRTFIKETLCQISDGMIDAQEELREKGVRINPMHRIDQSGNALTTEDSVFHGLQVVKFDIAIGAKKTSGKAGSAALTVLTLSLSGKAGTSDSNSTVSRVSFEIVAHLPQSTVAGK